MINNIIGGVERLETVKTAVRDIRMLGLMQGIFQQVAIVNKFIPVAFFSSVKIAGKNRRRLSRNSLNFFPLLLFFSLTHEQILFSCASHPKPTFSGVSESQKSPLSNSEKRSFL